MERRQGPDEKGRNQEAKEQVWVDALVYVFEQIGSLHILATGRTRVIKKVVPTDSFFNFFKPPQPPTPEALEAEDVDEDELEELDARLETDYQLGEEFKEKIIPRAVDYFTGKALKYEDDFEDEEEDDEDDEDDFDEDDEEVSFGRGCWVFGCLSGVGSDEKLTWADSELN